jgi:uncharacterized protein YhaN
MNLSSLFHPGAGKRRVHDALRSEQRKCRTYQAAIENMQQERDDLKRANDRLAPLDGLVFHACPDTIHGGFWSHDTQPQDCPWCEADRQVGIAHRANCERRAANERAGDLEATLAEVRADYDAQVKALTARAAVVAKSDVQATATIDPSEVAQVVAKERQLAARARHGVEATLMDTSLADLAMPGEVVRPALDTPPVGLPADLVAQIQSRLGERVRTLHDALGEPDRKSATSAADTTLRGIPVQLAKTG